MAYIRSAIKARREWRSWFRQRLTGAFLRSIAPSLALGLLTAFLLQLVARLPGAAPASPDATPISRITWAAIVCVSLGLATAVARQRVVAMTLAGAAGAPVAFILARATRRGSVGLLHALDGGAPSPLLIGTIKGIEYGCLGLALSWLGRRGSSGALAYATAGLAAGVGFGGANLLVTMAASPGPLTFPTLLAWTVNELMFPVGCALVVWTADRRHRAPLPA